LNQVSSWINDLYEQKKASAAPASSSVKVNWTLVSALCHVSPSFLNKPALFCHS
jgi:hypothetical protein